MDTCIVVKIELFDNYAQYSFLATDDEFEIDQRLPGHIHRFCNEFGQPRQRAQIVGDALTCKNAHSFYVIIELFTRQCPHHRRDFTQSAVAILFRKMHIDLKLNLQLHGWRVEQNFMRRDDL